MSLRVIRLVVLGLNLLRLNVLVLNVLVLNSCAFKEPFMKVSFRLVPQGFHDGLLYINRSDGAEARTMILLSRPISNM